MSATINLFPQHYNKGHLIRILKFAEQIVSKGCNNLNVLESLAKGVSVSHPGTQPCPDGTHQPSEALIQEYCGAPSVTQWASGVNVRNVINIFKLNSKLQLTYSPLLYMYMYFFL
jgi:hypothetical protein